MAFSSCAEQKVVDVAGKSPVAIGFDTYVGKATRAYEKGADMTSEVIDEMFVYGGYADDPTEFEKTTVSRTSSDQPWTYDELEYWVANQVIDLNKAAGGTANLC